MIIQTRKQLLEENLVILDKLEYHRGERLKFVYSIKKLEADVDYLGEKVATLTKRHKDLETFEATKQEMESELELEREKLKLKNDSIEVLVDGLAAAKAVKIAETLIKVSSHNNNCGGKS